MVIDGYSFCWIIELIDAWIWFVQRKWTVEAPELLLDDCFWNDTIFCIINNGIGSALCNSGNAVTFPFNRTIGCQYHNKQKKNQPHTPNVPKSLLGKCEKIVRIQLGDTNCCCANGFTKKYIGPIRLFARFIIRRKHLLYTWRICYFFCWII